MLKDTKNLQAGDLITHLDGHKLGKPVKVTRFVEVAPDGTVEVDVEQPVEWQTSPRRHLRHENANVVPGEVALTDREVGTLIDALAMTRDRLIEQGYTGNDCSTALAKVTSLVQPSTWGLKVTQADRPE
jgi:hypothetical protein